MTQNKVLNGKKSLDTTIAWIIFIGLILLLTYFSINVISASIALGNSNEPLFWVWLILWGIHGFFWHEQIMFLKKRSGVYTFFVMAFFFSLYFLSKMSVFPIITKYLHLIIISPLTGLLRGLIVEVFLGKKLRLN